MMSIDENNYPTQFYGRTRMDLAGVLIFAPLALSMCIIGVLCCFDIMKPIANDPGFIVGTSLIIVGLILMHIVIDWAFHVFAKQRPIIRICREGIVLRIIGTLFPSNLIVTLSIILGYGIILIPLIVLWRYITLQSFRIRTFRWQWENIGIDSTKAALVIIDWHEKKRYDNIGQEEYVDINWKKIIFESHAFKTPIGEVIEAIQFFLHNSDVRETLPSWQDEEALFGNDTFDFDEP
jgi:hypothetical protein